MGPGALQALRTMLKTLDIEMDGKEVSLSPVGCDVAHGQNNIIKDACANNSMVLELVTAARTICQVVRDRNDLRGNLNKKGVNVPPKYRLIRWGAAMTVVRYVHKNYNELSDLKVDDIDFQLKIFKKNKDVTAFLRKIFRILLCSQRFRQVSGPMDVFFCLSISFGSFVHWLTRRTLFLCLDEKTNSLKPNSNLYQIFYPF